jgi:hypothetical protein
MMVEQGIHSLRTVAPIVRRGFSNEADSAPSCCVSHVEMRNHRSESRHGQHVSIVECAAFDCADSVHALKSRLPLRSDEKLLSDKGLASQVATPYQ